MENKTIYISDFSLSEYPAGGCELNDFQIIQELNCDFVKSAFFYNGEGYDRFIVSNFFRMPEEGKRWLIDNARYSVIENDYKLFPNRVPPPGFIAEKQDLRNVEFLQAAEQVIFQTGFQKRIFDLNIDLPRGWAWNANLWSDEELDLFAAAPDRKNGRCMIMQSEILSKNTQGAVDLAKQLKIPFDLVGKLDYTDFIKTLSKYQAVILPFGIPESFSRVAAEARMCDVMVLTNDNCAFAHEEAYQFERFELIQYMKDKKKELFEILK